MFQFVLMLSQACLILNRGCRKPSSTVVWWYLVYIASLLALFMNFFVNSYTGKGKKKRE